MNGKAVLLIIIGLLFICVGVNYDTIIGWINKEKSEEVVTEPVKITPINPENYPTDVGRYFAEKEANEDKVYIVMNVSDDTLTIAEKPSDTSEISKIPESKYKTYNYAPDIKIYYYDVIIKKDADTIIDKSEEIKSINKEEVPSIVRLREDSAYIEFENDKITQLLIFSKKEQEEPLQQTEYRDN